ncbi:EAL domain-containing protein (plasmid) [Paraburkholderia sprentiae WSM5005]|uniref:EAL domain-containing protein n=1 Tax=Paraburkholderia sprentiae WSM5005 TaxID=754502 RepID=A0A1I9YVB6_9BURK|nr:EAL domain-containing protein [Paraburkholderia sprentiae]APA90146.2 EAL domain-containing protein [Paraburkholderia sprentiae WSM5005]
MLTRSDAAVEYQCFFTHARADCESMQYISSLGIAGVIDRWRRRHRVDRQLIITIALVLTGLVIFALGMGYTLIWHERSDALRNHALRARDDIETLQAVHIQANADFLLGLDSARVASFAWPVPRVVSAATCFDRLEESYASDPRSERVVRRLRAETARWAWLLADIAVRARMVDGRATVDSPELLEANRMLANIIAQLVILRDAQTASLRAAADSATRHLVIERTVLAITALAACFLFCYALVAHYRTRLARQRARVIAQESERRFRQYFYHHPLAMLIFDVDTLSILAANRAAASQYGRTRRELGSLDMASLYASADLPSFLHDLRALLAAATRSGSAGMCRHRHRDGTPVYVELSYHFLTYARRRACFITAVDVTEKQSAELALLLRSRALDAIGNGVLITRPDPHGDVVEYANPAFEKITGCARRQIEGHHFAWPETSGLREQISTAIADKREATTLTKSRRANGAEFWYQLYVAPVSDESDKVTHHISVVSDLTELIESRDLLLRQARRDALTDLPNRVTLREMIDTAILERREFALLFIDLDHFKDINDSLGHGAGDRLLQEVARRLSTSVGSDGVVTRYGGDEFVTMFNGSTDDVELSALLARVTRTLNEPVQVDDMQLRVRMSIGVSCYPQDGTDCETLLKHADLAMYRVKAGGRNGVERFSPALADAAAQRIALSHKLRNAAERNDFELVYQPQVDIRHCRLTGVEALIRWHDADFGTVSPTTFIPLAEDIGLIASIGEWALQTACAQAKRWEEVLPGLRMSVNVSPSQLASSDFGSVVGRALAASQLAADRLELEITEGGLVAPGALPTLRALHDLGVSIAIDDFGAGYSSLSYLRTFHADRLKIDMSFIRGIGTSRADETIIGAIIALARKLRFEVVAEGVERVEQLAFLAQAGCETVQGYYFAAPQPAASIPAYAASLMTELQNTPS